MEEEKLTCTKVIQVNDGRDQQGRMTHHHQRCGAIASECEVGGTLTKARAVLCETHRLQADREAFVSENGYPLGKVTKKDKEKGYQQPRLPGTGLLTK